MLPNDPYLRHLVSPLRVPFGQLAPAAQYEMALALLGIPLRKQRKPKRVPKEHRAKSGRLR